MLLSEADRTWLAANYRGLTIGASETFGVVEIDATYNESSNRFLILGPNVPNEIGGLRLEGTFPVHIAARADKSISKLPAVHIEGVDTSTDRHFSQLDKSACL